MWQSAGLIDIKFDKCALDHATLRLSKDPCQGIEAEAEKHFLLPSVLARTLRHFYFHTEIHLIHRSAVEFLKHNIRAKTFMEQAGSNKSSRDEMIFKSSQCALKIQAYLLRQIYLSQIQGDNASDIVHSLRRHLEEGSCVSYRAQQTIMMKSMVSYLNQRFPKNQNEHLDAIGVWYTQEARNLIKYLPNHWSNKYLTFPFSAPLPPDQLFYGRAAAHGEGQYFLERLADNFQAEAPSYFDVAIDCLTNLCAHNIFNTSMTPYLQIIKRCLQTGLDPNLGDPYIRAPYQPTYLGSMEGSAWQTYLRCIQKCTFMITEASVLPSLFERILSLAYTFQGYGAEKITDIDLDLDTGLGQIELDRYEWLITVKYSSVDLLASLSSCIETGNKWCWKSSPVGRAPEYSTVSSIIRYSQIKRSTKCSQFSLSQQQEISASVEPALAEQFQSQNDSPRREQAEQNLDIILGRLRLMLARIWEENQNSIVVLD